MTLSKGSHTYTHASVTKHYNRTPYGLAGNETSVVALAMHHRFGSSGILLVEAMYYRRQVSVLTESTANYF